MEKRKTKIPTEIRNYMRNDHRICFLVNPVKEEMYVDYGEELTEEEMIEAGTQIAWNIIDHIPDEKKMGAVQVMTDSIRQYVNSDE